LRHKIDRLAVTTRTIRVSSPLYREWDYLRCKFAVGYAPFDEIEKRLVHYFFDSRASFIRHLSYRSHHFLIEMIYPPPANAKGFNLVWPLFRECFRPKRCPLHSYL
jgi:hypothetical protein